MQTNSKDINKGYIIGVTALTFIVPVICTVTEHFIKNTALTLDTFGKWFIFSAVGLRLLLAGIRQTVNPGFTAKEIFHIDNPESLSIVRELGFANFCFGLVGVISLFKPEWRIVSAFASGIYYAAAGIQHLIKKPAGANEKFALWTDLIIFVLLLIFFVKSI